MSIVVTQAIVISSELDSSKSHSRLESLLWCRSSRDQHNLSWTGVTSYAIWVTKVIKYCSFPPTDSLNWSNNLHYVNSTWYIIYIWKYLLISDTEVTAIKYMIKSIVTINSTKYMFSLIVGYSKTLFTGSLIFFKSGPPMFTLIKGNKTVIVNLKYFIPDLQK